MKTLMMQAGARGSDPGRIDLDIENGRVIGHRRTRIPLAHELIPSDATARRLLTELLNPRRTALEEVVGTASDWLIRAQAHAAQESRRRSEVSPVDSLFTDILREESDADIALHSEVGYGVAIPAGPISEADLRQFLPDDGRDVTMSLSATDVLEILEQGVENTLTDDLEVKVDGTIQVSGVRCRNECSRDKEGERFVHCRREHRIEVRAAPSLSFTEELEP